MSGVFIPADAPFTTEQQAWLAGFFLGIAANRGAAEETAAPALTVQVLYGSQTGNAEGIANDLALAARAHGVRMPVRALDDIAPDEFAALENVVVVVSTYGEGEMPDNAELFWESLGSADHPRLEGLRFAVLALGDSGYDDFCQAGRLIDIRLEQLGGARLHPRTDCDVDFEEPAAEWIAGIVARFAAEIPGGGGAALDAPAAESAPKRSQWTKKRPYESRLVENRPLSGAGSSKEIRHYEFALGDSGIAYAAGDAFGVVPVNDPRLVDLLIAELGFRPGHEVDGVPLIEHFGRAAEIVTPSKELLAFLSEHLPESEPARLIARGERESLDEWLWGKDILDVVQATGLRIDPEEFVSLLRPLQPRAYSISSSPLHSPDRVHLTVASVRYGADRAHGGVCSTFLADRLGSEEPVGVYLQPNQAFRLPGDGSTPVIMIGPGTGVAPFRGFLQERAAAGATGKNWLFFGDQHRASDFIYEDELTGWAEGGVLTKLDLAFSRDQADKVYVQTRMREEAAELYAWLEEGAHLYVCGDASRMAKDVERALLDVVAEQRGRGEEEAAEYVASLKRSKRYLRDVY